MRLTAFQGAGELCWKVMERGCRCVLDELCDSRRDGGGVPFGRRFLDPPHGGGGRAVCATKLCQIRLPRPECAGAQRQKLLMCMMEW